MPAEVSCPFEPGSFLYPGSESILDEMCAKVRDEHAEAFTPLPHPVPRPRRHLKARRLPAGAVVRPPAPVVSSTASDPGTHVIPFGKHKGRTIADVWSQSRGYVIWLSEVAETPRLRQALDTFLEARR